MLAKFLPKHINNHDFINRRELDSFELNVSMKSFLIYK